MLKLPRGSSEGGGPNWVATQHYSNSCSSASNHAPVPAISHLIQKGLNCISNSRVAAVTITATATVTLASAARHPTLGLYSTLSTAGYIFHHMHAISLHTSNVPNPDMVTNSGHGRKATGCLWTGMAQDVKCWVANRTKQRDKFGHKAHHAKPHHAKKQAHTSCHDWQATAVPCLIRRDNPKMDTMPSATLHR